MHMALDFETQEFDGETQPRTPLEISRICKILNLEFVKRFLQKHSFLFHTRCKFQRDEVGILMYSIPLQLRNFFFDPGRCRHLYSMTWIIGNCWEAIKYVLEMEPTSHSTFAVGLQDFFIPKRHYELEFSGASFMLSESIRNGCNDDNLLRFLEFLCRVPWDTCFRSDVRQICTLAIAQWVSKALVS